MSDNEQPIPARVTPVPPNLPANVQHDVPGNVPATWGMQLASSRGAGESLPETIRRIRRALRGRYAWLLVFVLFGALAGGAAGWRYAPLRYRSEALVHIAYSLPQVFQETEQNKPMELFDTFLQSQKLLITSRRLVDLAMSKPAWRATGRGTSALVQSEFVDNIEVLANSRTEYLRIIYNDRDPAIAAAGAQSLVAAYVELYDDQNHRLEEQISAAAHERSKNLGATLEELDRKIGALASEVGSTNLDSLYESAVQRFTRLQTARTDLQLALARAGTNLSNLSPEQLIEQYGTHSGLLQKYYEEMVGCENYLSMLRTRYGENHRMVQDARNSVQIAKDRFDDYLQRLRSSATQPTSETGVASPDSLRGEAAVIEKLMAQANKDMMNLGQQRWNMQQLLKSRDETREELVKANRRIETLQSESAVGGRLSIISAGETPLKPARDLRPVASAAVGLAGGLLPLAAVILWNLCRARFRYSDDAQAAIGTEVTLLGILPNLRKNNFDNDTMAAQSIHQIRVGLSASDSLQESRAYLITSPAAGDGKTSISLALGLSFAASGIRTLVIDFDLAARQLSRSVCDSATAGLPEALDAGHVNGFVQEFDGLSVLTAGSARSLDANAIGPAYLRRLINSARKQYGVILIDTGPILGSVEAALAAREVDGAILAISAGQQQAMVGRALLLLKSLGTRSMGVIFNRADAKDFFRSTYASARSVAVDSPAAPTDTVTTTSEAATTPSTSRRFSPLVRAVLTSLSKPSHLAPP